MKVVLTGGGSGGHITPLLAVAEEIKKNSKDTSIFFIGGRGDRFSHLVEGEQGKALISQCKFIFAGKLRRYHGESWVKRIFDIKTNLLNLRDLILALVGFLQSIWVLIVNRPDVIFVKGGYVTLPVGLAAALLRIPYITHDSDVVPGLTNRIIAPMAKYNCVNIKSSHHKYKKDKTVQVGTPVREEFKPLSPSGINRLKKNLGVGKKQQVLLVTGGSLGARNLNKAIVDIVPELLESSLNLTIFHQVGQGNLGQWRGFSHSRLIVKEFIEDLYNFSGAADLIITRAGASTLSEYATQKKACLVVPHPHLTGGHQLKNAQTLGSENAAVIVNQQRFHKPDEARKIITGLLNNPVQRRRLGENLHKLMPSNAAAKLAKIIIKIGSKEDGKTL